MISKSQFRQTIYSYYRKNGRKLPWRYETDPYKILVSETMLQQTQVARVLVKYPQFLKRFPTISSLSNSSLREVVIAWQGLGYNRRCLFLHNCTKQIIQDHNGIIPQDNKILEMLPGIGNATAGAIMAYAFNKPAVFIETNIRSVFLHFYFQKQVNVSDAEILQLVEETLDRKNPREWYYGLTDYGGMLKKEKRFTNVQSRHYVKQSKFEKSNRQARGIIIRELTQGGCFINVLQTKTKLPQNKFNKVIQQLKKEGLIVISSKGIISLRE